MIKVLISLNFMYCMERFATQIYRTQKPAFGIDEIAQKLVDASENERSHVNKLQAQIKLLNGRIYPFAFLLMGSTNEFLIPMTPLWVEGRNDTHFSLIGPDAEADSASSRKSILKPKSNAKRKQRLPEIPKIILFVIFILLFLLFSCDVFM